MKRTHTDIHTSVSIPQNTHTQTDAKLIRWLCIRTDRHTSACTNTQTDKQTQAHAHVNRNKAQITYTETGTIAQADTFIYTHSTHPDPHINKRTIFIFMSVYAGTCVCTHTPIYMFTRATSCILTYLCTLRIHTHVPLSEGKPIRLYIHTDIRVYIRTVRRMHKYACMHHRGIYVYTYIHRYNCASHICVCYLHERWYTDTRTKLYTDVHI